MVLGGRAADTIDSGVHDDVIIGDDGSATFNAAGILTFIITGDPTVGGGDTITVGNGNNVILGGSGGDITTTSNRGDTISSGNGSDVVIGDNGNATFTDAGVLTYITTSAAGVAGDYDDVINVSDGYNVVLGGNGSDTITSGDDMI